MSGIVSTLDLIDDIRTTVAEYTGHPYVIAGGCLRDAFFGKPIKDIDLIVPCDRQWEHLTTWPETEQYGPTGGFMAGDTDILVRGKYPVQLIYRGGDTSIDGMLEYHSLAVSNFFYEGGVLSIDPQAIRDYQDKKHTLNTKRWLSDGPHNKVASGQTVRLQKYIDKIKVKYPWEIRE